MDGWKEGMMDRCINEWTDGWVEGWMDRWMNEWWIIECLRVVIRVFFINEFFFFSFLWLEEGNYFKFGFSFIIVLWFGVSRLIF